MSAWIFWIIVGCIAWMLYKAFDPTPLHERKYKAMLNPTRPIPENMSVKNLQRCLDETLQLIDDLKLGNRSIAGKKFIELRDNLQSALEEAKKNEASQPEASNVKNLREATDDGEGREEFMFGKVKLVVGFNPNPENGGGARYEVYTRKSKFVAHSYHNRHKAKAAARYRIKEWSQKARKKAA